MFRARDNSTIDQFIRGKMIHIQQVLFIHYCKTEHNGIHNVTDGKSNISNADKNKVLNALHVHCCMRYK